MLETKARAEVRKILNSIIIKEGMSEGVGAEFCVHVLEEVASEYKMVLEECEED